MSKEKLIDIYIAIPYTHRCRAIKEYRFQLCTCYAAQLTKSNLKKPLRVFSPITHSHPFDVYGTPTNWEFWEKIDCGFLNHTKEVHVIMEDDWLLSTGVMAEITYAEKLGIPIKYIRKVDILEGVYDVRKT